MFTDLAGFTALTQTDEARALQVLQEQQEMVRPALEAHRGRQVKSIGDGLLIEFPNALDAVRCAVDLQQQVRTRNAREGATPLRLRIGIHLGDVQEEGADILGDAVNIASRIEPLAEPGGVCLSFPVYDQVHNKVTCKFERLGPRNLKGVRDAVEVYRVVFPWSSPRTAFGGPLLPRIAVLPLVNISPDPNDEYFADGLTEELISVLSQIKGLRVISHTSVNQYKGTTKPLAQIGSELGADTVLEGSVRKAGDQLRIAVQLIDARTDEHRWAQTYDRKFEDVFAIQSEVAERTAGALKVELLKSERDAIQERPTSSLTAYEFYLRGIQTLHLVGSRPYKEYVLGATRCFEAAIREDPQFAAAHACLATELVYLGGSGLPAREAFARARGLATKALELNPNSSDAHTAWGMVLFQADLDWARAEAEFQQAIALNPSNSSAHRSYGFLLWTLQRFAEAKKQALAAIELDPLLDGPRLCLADALWYAGDLDSAVETLEKAREVLGDSHILREFLSLAHSQAGRAAAALEMVATFEESPDLGARFHRAYVLAYLGRLEELRTIMTDAEEGRITEPFGVMARATG
jgi:adenylate cyclase